MEIRITENLEKEILEYCAKEADANISDIEINVLEFDKDGEVDIDFSVSGLKFDRIRRITGKPEK